MNTKTYSFKTNINCSGCVATVKPFLDKAEGIDSWEVNTEDRNKILSVQASGISGEQIIDTVKQAGYKAELLPESN